MSDSTMETASPHEQEQTKKRKRTRRFFDLKGKSIETLSPEHFEMNDDDDGASKQETVTAIDLCGNYITTLNPTVLSKFGNLTVLNLMSNELTCVPLLDSLPNLRELYLSKNKISKISNLGSYPKLSVLDLRANQISVLENLENVPYLTKLSLSSNKLTHIASLPPLNSLHALYLFGNQLCDKNDCLEGLTKCCKCLEILIMRANPIDPMDPSKEDESYTVFCKQLFATLPNLKWLDWQHVNSYYSNNNNNNNTTTTTTTTTDIK